MTQQLLTGAPTLYRTVQRTERQETEKKDSACLEGFITEILDLSDISFFFTVIQYTELQCARCNGLLLCAVGMVLLRESLAAVLLGWLLLSQRLVPVTEIDDIPATLLSAWYLRDRDTGDALQTLYTINPVCVGVCVCLLSGEQCLCVGGFRCVCLHMSLEGSMQMC